MKLHGELKGKTSAREIVKSPVVSILVGFKLVLSYNDVPVTLYYKHKNNPWKTLLVNNKFTPDAIPHNSDIYICGSLSAQESVIYSIDY